MAEQPLDDEAPSVTIERIDDTRRPPRDALADRMANPPARLARLALVLLAATVAGVALVPGGLRAWLPTADRFVPPDVSFAPATPIPVPARLISSRWETMPLPPGSPPNGWMVTLSPTDATSLDACATLGPRAADGSALPGPVDVWATHTAGATWAHVPFPVTRGTGCQVSATPGEPASAIATVYGDTGATPTPCLNAAFFRTTDGGAHWAPLAHRPLVPRDVRSASCEVLAIPHHLFFSLSYSEPGDAGVHSMLRRSDDGGATWVAADHGFKPIWSFEPQWAGGDTLILSLSSNAPAPANQFAVWVSYDLGNNWVPTSAVPTTRDLGMLSGAAASPLAPVCACTLATTSTGPRSDLSLYLAGRDWQWKRLPPLPSLGATPDKSGVFRVVGFTARGDPLALGIRSRPYPVTQDAGLGGQSNDDAPRLWEWDVGGQRWKTSAVSLPCPAPANCPLVSLGTRVGVGADGTRGTWVWLAQASEPHVTALYRAFVPGA